VDHTLLPNRDAGRVGKLYQPAHHLRERTRDVEREKEGCGEREGGMWRERRRDVEREKE
jgi:hypothetical protein